jgi:hypothetical protein
MKAMTTVLAAAALLVVTAAGPAGAQQHGTPQQPHHPEAKAGTPAPGPGPGMHGDGMPMMDMCRQMMGDGGGMAMTPADPKARAAMLEMRGEMMKAMGDIMMKHARRMHNVR